MKKRQSKKLSIIESITNTMVSTVVSFTTTLIVYPLIGIDVTIVDVSRITIIFTIISIVKNFLVRRFFETKYWRFFKRKSK